MNLLDNALPVCDIERLKTKKMTTQQNSPGLLQRISGFSREKIINTIKQRETSHIQVLKEFNLVRKNTTVEEIIDSVLGVGLEAEDREKVTTEFLSVCLFVLEIDNPWLDDLLALRSGSGAEEKWNNITKQNEVVPSEYYKGKPYEIFSCNCKRPSCRTCKERDSQQRKLKNQIRDYFPHKGEQPKPEILQELQEYIHKLQKQSNQCWENEIEFGGLCKKKDWKVPYVFGTEKMKQVLLRHLNSFQGSISESKDCFDTSLEQIRQKLLGLGFEFCCMKISGNPLQVEEKIGMQDQENKILMDVKELVNKPLSKSDIMKTLTRHSVGILHWQNHCQATVTCVGKNFVLAPAHIFQQENIEEKFHVEVKKSEAAIREMQGEIEKLSKIKEEELVNLKPEEMKIHIGYTEGVQDHFRENCCKYFVDEVMFINHKLDFSLLKVEESKSFKSTKELSARQSLVPMVLGSEDPNMSHIYVASHPFNRTLTIENFVKLLNEDEVCSFVKNFHIQAILQALEENNDKILRYASKPIQGNVPNMVLLHKFETDCMTKQLIKRSYSEGEIPGSHSNYKERNKVADEPKHKKLLVSLEKLKDGNWHSYSLGDFWHCDIPKRKSLQIPIPASRDGTNKPYRIIFTSRREQMSFACEIEEDGGDDKQGILKIRKLDCDIVVKEKPTKSLLLAVESERKNIKCGVEKGKFWVNDTENQKSDENGTIPWEAIDHVNSEEFKTMHVLRKGESCHFPEISLTVQNKKLHYSVKKKSTEVRLISCLEETIFKLELEGEGNGKKEDEKIGGENYGDGVVKIRVDGEEHELDLKPSQGATRGRNFKKERREYIHFKKDENWTGNVLMKRKHGIGNDKVQHMYCSLNVKWDNTTKKFKYKADSEWDKSRKVTLRDRDTEESYVVWPTDSLPSNFELQFPKKEKPRVTLSLIIYSDSYRVVEFDPDGRKSHGCLLRQVSSPGKPQETEYPHQEIARLEKISPSEEKQRFLQKLSKSFSDEKQKNFILNEDTLTEERMKYIGSHTEFKHLKLIDMEYGASGGACCYLDNQGQVTLHGMFLGACPPFYYNNEDLQHFFSKSGTCFNKILPSGKIKDTDAELPKEIKIIQTQNNENQFYIQGP
ncbi:uncharacterized protein LOC134256086 isoform X2 [Saccostrea cucullata]|uniref:uncharacterized protein LOC134256086 isoform X2 n=1 Tax=Saccostrea cuccullata TaxID=36930 RepID=UPI002ED55A42